MEDGEQWTHGIIVEANSTDHNSQSYTMRVTKMDRLNTHNIRHMCKTLKTVKQYLLEEIIGGTGHSEDIFTNLNSVKHNRV